VFATDELYVALVGSTKAHARILNVDTSAATALNGVVGYVDHNSVPGSNRTGISNVKEIFAVSEVQFVTLLAFMIQSSSCLSRHLLFHKLQKHILRLLKVQRILN
jgi:xanthine dehydrogenase molybdopterin-binding subunit B